MITAYSHGTIFHIICTRYIYGLFMLLLWSLFPSLSSTDLLHECLDDWRQRASEFGPEWGWRLASLNSQDIGIVHHLMAVMVICFISALFSFSQHLQSTSLYFMVCLFSNSLWRWVIIQIAFLADNAILKGLLLQSDLVAFLFLSYSILIS